MPVTWDGMGWDELWGASRLAGEASRCEPQGASFEDTEETRGSEI
jgi:hypothetical protein